MALNMNYVKNVLTTLNKPNAKPVFDAAAIETLAQHIIRVDKQRKDTIRQLSFNLKSLQNMSGKDDAEEKHITYIIDLLKLQCTHLGAEEKSDENKLKRLIQYAALEQKKISAMVERDLQKLGLKPGHKDYDLIKNKLLHEHYARLPT